MSQILPYNCDMRTGLNTSKNLVFKVKSTIYGHGRGWCLTPNDFLTMDHSTAVRQALSRLEKAGFIRRLAWGLYDYPRKHPKLGLLPPDIEQVVKALARKDNLKLLPSGALAANLLGLSNQVPAKVVYLTEGTPKRIRIGKQEIVFKTTTPKNMATAGTFAGALIQALRHLGQEHVDDAVIAKLKKLLKKEERLSLQKYRRYAPVWIQKVMTRLNGDDSRG